MVKVAAHCSNKGFNVEHKNLGNYILLHIISKFYMMWVLGAPII